MGKFWQKWKYTIELLNFKSGESVPRAHYIIFMTLTLKVNFHNPTFVDIIMSAEIRDYEHSRLRQVVSKHNMHNPCSHLNLSSVCMIDDICSKLIPKEFVDDTIHAQSSNLRHVPTASSRLWWWNRSVELHYFWWIFSYRNSRYLLGGDLLPKTFNHVSVSSQCRALRVSHQRDRVFI